VDVVLSDEVLDRIDEIVPPGTDIGTLDQAYVPPAIQQTELRRRPLSERSAGPCGSATTTETARVRSVP
jgi:hypothetical protein